MITLFPKEVRKVNCIASSNASACFKIRDLLDSGRAQFPFSICHDRWMSAFYKLSRMPFSSELTGNLLE